MAAPRRRDDRFLELAHSMRVQIRRFAEAVVPSNEGGSTIDARGRESELRVAIEELRAQNDALFEACGRLESEMAKYRDLYDSAPDAFVTTDARGVIVDANPATAALFGVPHGILAGKLLIAFVARRDTILFRDQLRALDDGPGHGTFHSRIRPRRRSPVVAHFTVRTVRGSALATDGAGERADAHPVAFHWTIRVEDEPVR